MKTLAAILTGLVIAFLVLVVLSAIGGSIGPVELLVIGLPAFALGYWLARRLG